MLALLSVLATALLDGCADPVHNAEVAALGPEANGVPPGPTHRPGQPCLTCHGGEGPGGLTFVTAGTVYVNQYSPDAGSTALNGGVVHLVDSEGHTFDSKTNTVGNFYVTTDQWSPVFPLGDRSMDAGLVGSACIPATSPDTEYGGLISVAAPPDAGCKNFPTTMASSIDRGGVYASCAYCHFDPPGPTSPGHVFLQ